jgi:hypothetical protein
MTVIRRGRPMFSEWDFVSSDGSVIITCREFAELEKRCPAIANVRRMVRAACRGWLLPLPPSKRKAALIQWLIKRGESMSPPKLKTRHSTTPHSPQPYSAYADRSGPIPDFETYVQRFIRDGDDEQTRQEIEGRCREVWERRRRREFGSCGRHGRLSQR